MESRGGTVPERVLRGVVRGALPELGHHGSITLIPSRGPRPPLQDQSVVRSMNTLWTLRGFALERTPSLVGVVEQREEFSTGDPLLVADLPIKVPGSLAHLVPVELAMFSNVVQRCIEFEVSVNDRYEPDYFTYLTVHRAYVRRGDSLRGGLPHSDSLQGPRIQPKRVIEHGYLTADADPPRFYTHAFDLGGLDADRDNVARALADQADIARTFQGAPFDIYLFDAYCVHEAVPATTSGTRTFFRLTMSTREFDRLGNTRNCELGVSWQLEPRPIDPSLR